jgi:hypothetical protein
MCEVVWTVGSTAARTEVAEVAWHRERISRALLVVVFATGTTPDYTANGD